MPTGRMFDIIPGFRQWQQLTGGTDPAKYKEWLSANGYQNAQDFVARGTSGGALVNPLTGQPYPVPGAPRTPGGPSAPPVAPPSAGPPPLAPSTAPPSYAPPPVAMQPLLPNPQPQGLGGMPMMRDRMMGAVMAPFAQPNWGVQQVNPQYLTQQTPLPGGAVPSMAIPLAPPVTPPPVAPTAPGAELMPVPGQVPTRVPQVGWGGRVHMINPQLGYPRGGR